MTSLALHNVWMDYPGQRVLERDNWRCQNCGCAQNLEVHHRTLRSQQGDDSEPNLITLCNSCHSNEHR